MTTWDPDEDEDDNLERDPFIDAIAAIVVVALVAVILFYLSTAP